MSFRFHGLIEPLAAGIYDLKLAPPGTSKHRLNTVQVTAAGV